MKSKYWIALFGTMLNVAHVFFVFLIYVRLYYAGMTHMSSTAENYDGVFIFGCVTLGFVGLFYMISCMWYYTNPLSYDMPFWQGLKYGVILSTISGFKYWLLGATFIFGSQINSTLIPIWLSIMLCCICGVLWSINFFFKLIKGPDEAFTISEQDITGFYGQLDSHLKKKVNYEITRENAEYSLKNLLSSSKY